MGKITKKLSVYLDQSIISAITKRRHDAGFEHYERLFQALHEGFLDEKLSTPESPSHKHESIFDTRIEDEIFRNLGQVGQVELLSPEEIKIRHLECAIKEFKAPGLTNLSIYVTITTPKALRSCRPLRGAVEVEYDGFSHRSIMTLTDKGTSQNRSMDSMNETREEVKTGTYIWAARENRFNPPTDNADDMITGVMVNEVDDPDDWFLYQCESIEGAITKAEQARELFRTLGPNWTEISRILSS